ncbi:exosortase-associated protein EpsI, V-type [Sphingomonas sp.]|uniref:exosortase-associated protein EpsI, V-type n=1 Tax=Sphingomonas sp. TaxID=28214 RepID=UPI00286C2176|nr:exosortase-associated protein EpsI, V-type [Sphingomonas sp.]
MTDDIHKDRLDRRKFLIGGAFLGAAALAYARTPRTVEDFLGKAKLDDIIPKHFADWSFVSASGLVTAPEDQLSRLLYSQLLTRVYSAPNQPSIMMLAAQSASQTGVLQIHRPEVCYPAGGFQLSPVIEHDIPVGPLMLRTNQLTATADGRSEQIVYWTRIGRHLPISWSEQRWAVAQDNMRGIIPDAVLVRISVSTNDRDEALAVIDGFTRSLIASLSPLARKVLIGVG